MGGRRLDPTKQELNYNLANVSTTAFASNSVKYANFSWHGAYCVILLTTAPYKECYVVFHSNLIRHFHVAHNAPSLPPPRQIWHQDSFRFLM